MFGERFQRVMSAKDGSSDKHANGEQQHLHHHHQHLPMSGESADSGNVGFCVCFHFRVCSRRKLIGVNVHVKLY